MLEMKAQTIFMVFGLLPFARQIIAVLSGISSLRLEKVEFGFFSKFLNFFFFDCRWTMFASEKKRGWKISSKWVFQFLHQDDTTGEVEVKNSFLFYYLFEGPIQREDALESLARYVEANIAPAKKGVKEIQLLFCWKNYPKTPKRFTGRLDHKKFLDSPYNKEALLTWSPDSK